ncbi:hypothetical protein STEG23_003475 [Scotinomys teguina]
MAAAAAPYITRTSRASRRHHTLLHSGVTRQRRTAAPYKGPWRSEVNIRSLQLLPLTLSSKTLNLELALSATLARLSTSDGSSTCRNCCQSVLVERFLLALPPFTRWNQKDADKRLKYSEIREGSDMHRI